MSVLVRSTSFWLSSISAFGFTSGSTIGGRAVARSMNQNSPAAPPMMTMFIRALVSQTIRNRESETPSVFHFGVLMIGFDMVCDLVTMIRENHADDVRGPGSGR